MVVGALLTRGMLVGLLAALLSFAFLKIVGEPAVDRAIAFESQMDAAKAKAKRDEAVAKGLPMPAEEDEPELVSRPVQAGIGLFTGVVGLQRRLRRPVRAGLCAGLRPDGAVRAARHRGAAGAVRPRRGLCRPQPQISRQPALGRRPRHDRHADRPVFLDDRLLARGDDRRLDAAQPPHAAASAPGTPR